MFGVVKSGSKGTDVYICQAFLKALQYTGADGKPLTVDGVAGNNTVHAINSFQSTQRAYGYECGTSGRNDGSFGPACWRRVGM